MATKRSKGSSSNSEGDKKKLTISAEIIYYINRPIKATFSARNKTGATLYEGRFNGTIPIALKKYQSSDQKIAPIKDLKVLCSKENNHPNIIRYFGHKEDDTNTYIAIELCECSVDDIIDPAKRATAMEKKPDMMKSILSNLLPKEILRQSTEAVSYLHVSLKTIHRNLHPDNFLVACVDPNNDHFLIKLTDFQYSKDWIENIALSGTSGSNGWVAPEMIQAALNHPNNWEPGPEIDIFILGCYYHYVLSGGKHPFGKTVIDRRANINIENHSFYSQPSWVGSSTTGPIPNEPYFSSLSVDDYDSALDLIKKMVVWDPFGRSSLSEVSQHQFFKLEPAYNIYNKIDPDDKTMKPGLCVIISQGKYHNPIMDCGYTCRVDTATGGTTVRGILVDTYKLGNVFTSFGYDVRLFKNLRAQQIQTALTPEFLTNKLNIDSLDQYASLVVCILGHGDKGVVCGVDGAKVSLNGIQYGAFNRARCPELAGKPKMFITLACRGENQQKTTGQPSQFQDWKIKTPMSINQEQYIEDKSLNDDFLTLASTVEEFQTHFDRKNGSAFVEILCKSLEAEYNLIRKKTRDLVQLFHYDIVPKVSSWYGHQWAVTQGGYVPVYKLKQTPESCSSLTGTIRFQNHPNNGAINLIYDGELNDPSFKIARQLWPLRSYYNQVIGEENRNKIEYQILLKTIFAFAKNESELCQRAIAWSIFNSSETNPVKWTGRNIDKACKAFYFWHPKDDIIDETHPFHGIQSMDSELKKIDLWLPNVYNEWSEWDPSNGATHFSKEPIIAIDVYDITAKIGKFNFYKERHVASTNLANTDESRSQHQSSKGTKRKRK